MYNRFESSKESLGTTNDTYLEHVKWPFFA